MAVPTKNQTAETTAETFYNNFIIHYGIPTRLHSDQGANFESKIIKELCNLTNMKKSHTSIYHPQGNSGPERFNRTLLDMLGTLENSQKANWKKYVNHLVYSYNCTPHESTRVAPFELMFGRKPKLPIDAVFEQATDETTNKGCKEYIDELRDRMMSTSKMVEEHISKAKDRQKKYYDVKAKAARVEVGDKVLVKTLAFDGKHKIADKFDETSYTVIEQVKDNIPVYKVRADDSGRERTLHRNHLFLLRHQEHLGEDIENNVEETTTNKKDLSETMVDGDRNEDKVNDERSDVTVEEESDDDDDDDDDTGELVVYTRNGDAHYPVAVRDDSIDAVEDNLVEVEEDSTVVNVREDQPAVSGQRTDKVGEVKTETKDQKKQPEPEDTQTEIIESTDDVVEAERQADNKDTGGRPDEETRCKTLDREPPQPAPRRSARERKPPKRYEDYQMASIVPRPQDPRFQALQQVLGSGVLDELDSEMARRLVNSIFQ